MVQHRNVALSAELLVGVEMEFQAIQEKLGNFLEEGAVCNFYPKLDMAEFLE